jgi:CRP-like cAMP-binding protein
MPGITALKAAFSIRRRRKRDLKYDAMFDQLREKFPVDNEKWSDFISRFKRIAVPGKTILLKENEFSKKLYLIEKGSIRAWFNKDGKDLTVQFFFENETVASIESLRKGTPSPITLETIEPAVLWCIDKADMDRVVEEIKATPALLDMFINTIFERTFDYMKHFVSFIKDTPQQRYLHLVHERPQLVKRIPQHYIAAYLGITTVHLSRIKRQLAKRSGL